MIDYWPRGSEDLFTSWLTVFLHGPLSFPLQITFSSVTVRRREQLASLDKEFSLQERTRSENLNFVSPLSPFAPALRSFSFCSYGENQVPRAIPGDRVRFSFRVLVTKLISLRLINYRVTFSRRRTEGGGWRYARKKIKGKGKVGKQTPGYNTYSTSQMQLAICRLI